MQRQIKFGSGFALLVALAIGAPSARSQNWIQWKTADGGNGHYYALTLVATNWEAAEALAVSWGGTLVRINSAEEQKFVNDTFLTGALEHRPVWIGLLDASARKGPFKLKLGPVRLQVGDEPRPKYDKWVTGEAINYDNWHPSQPDHFTPDEHYAAMNWHYSDNRGAKGDWNDAPVNGTTGFGGNTTGPYFGLVERDYDPSLPVRRRISKTRMHLSLMFAVVAVLVVYFVGSRWRKKRVN